MTEEGREWAEHKIRLISYPQLDWDQIRAFLSEDVGGDAEAWADRVQGNLSDGEALVEFAGRECYRSWTPGLNPNVTRVREDSAQYLQNIVVSGHGSVLEHANYTFIFHNVSRVLTHEFVRHRAGVAVSQESLRFVRLDNIPFWMPDWAKDDPELMERAHDVLGKLEDFQAWMSDHFSLDEKGVPFSEKKEKTSFMRRFAPEGVATGIIGTINLRALRHIIYMRTALGAEEEIRKVFDEVARITLSVAPNIMADYHPSENQEWIPEVLKV